MEKRREFIKKSLMGTAGLAIGGFGFSAKSYASIRGANDRVNIAVIGLHGRGVAHIDAWCKLKESKNVRVTTLCDVHEEFYPSRSKMVKDQSGINPKTEYDMRKVFDDKNIDAVSIAMR